MAAMNRQTALERRLREVERERRRVRERIRDVRREIDPEEVGRLGRGPRLRRAATAAPPPPVEDVPPPLALGVLEMESPVVPDQETSLDFEPGPDGLDTKRVVMPRLQRTDLLRPSIGGHPAATRLLEPEHDRFRNYLGSAGLKRVREARREKGSPRARAIFMVGMVLTLGYILFKMVT